MKHLILNCTLVITTVLSAVPAAAADRRSVLVQTATVTQRTVADTLPAFGVVQPDADKIVGLSLAHAGIISKVWCRLGQQVRQGDLLLELETAPAARMEYQQAQAAVDFTRQELARKQQLIKQQLATQADVAAARKALSDALAALAAQRAQGKGQTVSRLRAPIEGIVTELNIKQGQRVQAETTALLLSPRDHLVAQLGVEPEESAQVSVGLAVEIGSVFDPATVAHGRVQEVHAMINPATRLVDVLVPLPPEQTDAFIPGMRITGLIRLAETQSLTLPRSALLADAKGPYLFRVENGRAKKVYVTKGIEQEDFVVVSGPVSAGDVVVISGNYELSDGMRIREIAR